MLWLLAMLTRSMPDQASAAAYDGGAWKEKQVPAEAPLHFDGPAVEYVPSRLAIMRSGLLSSGRMSPKRARPPSGGVPYREPGVVSPTQPTVMTADEAAAEAADPPDAEGLADGDFFAPPGAAAAPERGDGEPLLPASARTPATAARATTATAASSTRRRRRMMRRRRSRSFARSAGGGPDELPMIVAH